VDRSAQLLGLIVAGWLEPGGVEERLACSMVCRSFTCSRDVAIGTREGEGEAIGKRSAPPTRAQNERMGKPSEIRMGYAANTQHHLHRAE